MTMNTTPGLNASKHHAARVCLFQILCALDGVREPQNSNDIDEKLRDLFVAPLVTDDAVRAPAAGTVALEDLEIQQTDDETFAACCAAACALRLRQSDVDALIAPHSRDWSLSRMSLIDRTILRLAVFEGLVARSVPAAVACSEAVLLAKEFGEDTSPRFVNGVLGAVVRAAGAR